MDFLLVILVAIAVHRLWLYEDIFRFLRQVLSNISVGYPLLVKPLLCGPCFAFWAGVIALLLVEAAKTSLWLNWVVIPLALYPFTRAMVTLYWLVGMFCRKMSGYNGPGLPVHGQVGNKPCNCKGGLGLAQAAADGAIVQTPAAQFPLGQAPLVILLTNFYDFERVYSLTTVVLDQALALARPVPDRPGYRVEIWVQKGCDRKSLPVFPANVTVRDIVPAVTMVPDQASEAGLKTVNDFLATYLSNGITDHPVAVISHDLLFQEWFYVFATAIHQAAAAGTLVKTKWFHQCHSEANHSQSKESNKYRRTIPEGHKIISVSHANAATLAEYYSTDRSNVVVVPNVRGMIQWAHMGAVAEEIVQREHLMEADLVQVFPLSGTRMVAKGIGTVIEVFAKLKQIGYKVRLVVVNGHSVGTDVSKEVIRFKAQAARRGLDVEGDNPEVVFTSDRYPEMAAGIPGDAVADLMQVSNLFIFPTITEACSLVLMEAALAGTMLVLNSDLPTLADVIPHDQALWFPFGNIGGKPMSVDVSVVAETIDAAYRESKSLRAKRTVLREHGIERLGKTLAEVITTR